MDGPDYQATIQIFNLHGQLVRRIANGELIGSEGHYSWDGRTEQNTLALMGIYLVHFEAFNLKGNIISDTKALVLAMKPSARAATAKANLRIFVPRRFLLRTQRRQYN